MKGQSNWLFALVLGCVLGCVVTRQPPPPAKSEQPAPVLSDESRQAIDSAIFDRRTWVDPAGF